ncbi:hypothetical protein FV242_31780 [Methylobacterium sp. WL64]|uniref:hypothetical protein n=1 Tax=Methylobacterium sp. WL64 TaxID=2603894 RepID=UPI0011CCAC29|nr:hypothetical protein [Methylobacterium sp. WL64]TXM97350.1 hypothetical protein FV242_31780 [Methylobacterium sp. WL64]
MDVRSQISFYGCNMPEFIVRLFRGGVADDAGPQIIEAADPKSAAEQSLGRPVRGEAGKLGELCATVKRRYSTASKPDAIFYEDQNSN